MRALALVCLLGCGGASAERPLTVSLGIPRDQAIAGLKAHAYCPKPGVAPAKRETYPRCDRPGAEWGESWVSARYDADRLIELKRYERFSDDARAIERWNQLITERGKLTPESTEATATLKGRLLEPGTRAFKAFRVDAQTVVGVYLLTPMPPEDASILEAVIQAPQN